MANCEFKDKLFTKFQFNQMQEGQAPRGVQSVVFHLDPSDHIRDIAPFDLKGNTSGWLRLELTKSTLMGQDEDKNDQPIQFESTMLSRFKRWCRRSRVRRAFARCSCFTDGLPCGKRAIDQDCCSTSWSFLHISSILSVHRN